MTQIGLRNSGIIFSSVHKNDVLQAQNLSVWEPEQSIMAFVISIVNFDKST